MSNFLFLLGRCIEKSNLAEIPYTFKGHEEAQVLRYSEVHYVLRIEVYYQGRCDSKETPIYQEITKGVLGLPRDLASVTA
jgi:hypothetical protein